MIIKISLDIKKSVLICDNLWTTKTSVEIKNISGKNRLEIIKGKDYEYIDYRL